MVNDQKNDAKHKNKYVFLCMPTVLKKYSQKPS